VLVILFTACSRSSVPGSSQESAAETRQLRQRLTELIRQEQTIAAEYALARNPAPYLVVDLAGRSIDLKASARNLRSFKVTDIKRSDSGGKEITTWILLDKKPLQRSERPKITPGAGEQGAAAAGQALWGPDRLPSDYDLIFDDGRVLEIRALPTEQSGLRITRALASLYRRMLDRYRHWRARNDTAQRYALQIWLSENDSQLLFWSLPKEFKALIIDRIRLP
jgi:hypothetical protein